MLIKVVVHDLQNYIKKIKPEKGKLLVFQNIYDNSNIKHPLNELEGMSVIEGEIWTFNL